MVVFPGHLVQGYLVKTFLAYIVLSSPYSTLHHRVEHSSGQFNPLHFSEAICLSTIYKYYSVYI
jgi:hypothetical protein